MTRRSRFTTGNKSAVGADCAAVLVGEIAKAEHGLLVQAYNLTESRIMRPSLQPSARRARNGNSRHDQPK
jgi:hypothetical protein